MCFKRKVTNNTNAFCLFVAVGLLDGTFALELPKRRIFIVQMENVRFRGTPSFLWKRTVGGNAACGVGVGRVEGDTQILLT